MLAISYFLFFDHVAVDGLSSVNKAHIVTEADNDVLAKICL